MSYAGRLKTKLIVLITKRHNGIAARNEEAESVVAGDSAVAGSRAGADGANGDYVGRTTPTFDAEDRQSGAEARSEANRRKVSGG